MDKKLKVVLIQHKVGPKKTDNVTHVMTMIRKACKEHSPNLVILPEFFNSLYVPKYFSENAELIPNGFTCQELSKVAKEMNVYIIGGSIPEKDPEDPKIVYNTCTIWSPDGKMMDKHRKLHLYDVNRKDVQFKESSVCTPGNKPTMVTIGPAKIGIGICFDSQFDELARLYRNQGCNFLVYPMSYCDKGGPMAVELVQRGRALDCQCYVTMVCSARDPSSEFVSYGYSMIVDPWTTIIKKAGTSEEVICATLDFAMCEEVRQAIPLFQKRRTDIYDTIMAKKY